MLSQAPAPGGTVPSTTLFNPALQTVAMITLQGYLVKRYAITLDEWAIIQPEAQKILSGGVDVNTAVNNLMPTINNILARRKQKPPTGPQATLPPTYIFAKEPFYKNPYFYIPAFVLISGLTIFSLMPSKAK